MDYVQRVLQPGERVRHISPIHWIVYWPGVVVALLAVVAYWLSDTRLLPGIWRYTAYALALVAVVLLIQRWFQCWVTEIAVTNRRVIYKKGLIRRQTSEMKFDVHPNQITTWKAQLEGGAADVFGAGSTAPITPTVDVKSLHAKIGELTLENDFLEGALTKAGLLSAKR